MLLVLPQSLVKCSVCFPCLDIVTELKKNSKEPTINFRCSLLELSVAKKSPLLDVLKTSDFTSLCLIVEIKKVALYSMTCFSVVPVCNYF